MTFQGYMRATVFEDKRAVMPGYAQPKDNGIRCLWDGRVAWTREGNRHCRHIQDMLYHKLRGKVGKGWTLDGELVLNRHVYSFQKCQSAVKKDGHLSSSLEYVVFDGHIDSRYVGPIFSERIEILKEARLNMTSTVAIPNFRTLNFFYKRWLADKYEGLIFRADVPYIFGSGGRNLMKKKPVKHAEFIIIGVWEGTSGTPVYRLARPDVPYIAGAPASAKNSFGAVPEGDYDEKRELWKEAQMFNLTGTLYTVKFWDYYESGVPQFPIGVGVRDYE